jgi:hypothetical protein
MIVLLYIEICRVQSIIHTLMNVFYTFHVTFFLFSLLDSEPVGYNKPGSLFSKFIHFSHLRNIFLQKMQMAFLPDSEANKTMYVF